MISQINQYFRQLWLFSLSGYRSHPVFLVTKTALMVLGFLMFLGCDQDTIEDQVRLGENTANHVYEFSGSVLELSGSKIQRKQTMQLEVFQYCVLNCADTVRIMKQFQTDAEGNYFFELGSDEDLENYGYTLQPMDSEFGYFLAISDDAAISYSLELKNQLDVTIAVAALVEIGINVKGGEEAFTMFMNNCVDVFPKKNGCSATVFKHTPVERDTSFLFRYPFEVSPSLAIEWQIAGSGMMKNGSVVIDLKANELSRLDIEL